MLVQDFCRRYRACRPGWSWLRRNCTTMQQAWSMVKPEWLIWISACDGVLDTQDRKKFVAYCGELLLPILNRRLYEPFVAPAYDPDAAWLPRHCAEFYAASEYHRRRYAAGQPTGRTTLVRNMPHEARQYYTSCTLLELRQEPGMYTDDYWWKLADLATNTVYKQQRMAAWLRKNVRPVFA